MRDDFERAVLDRLAEIRAGLGEVRGEQKAHSARFDGIVALQRAHEVKDAEAFASVNKRLDQLDADARRLADADTSQRLDALGQARTTLATRESQTFAQKHGVTVAVLGMVLSIAGGIVTALLLRGGG